MKNLVLLLLVFPLSACSLSPRKVPQGNYGRLYAESGVYIELFVSPDNPNDVRLEIGSDSADKDFVIVHFDGVDVRKVSMHRKPESVLLSFAHGTWDLENISLKAVKIVPGHSRQVLEYKLERNDPAEPKELRSSASTPLPSQDPQ